MHAQTTTFPLALVSLASLNVPNSLKFLTIQTAGPQLHPKRWSWALLNTKAATISVCLLGEGIAVEWEC